MEMGMEHERNNIYSEEQQKSGQAFPCKYHTANVPNRHYLCGVLIEKTRFQVSRSTGQKSAFTFGQVNGYATAQAFISMNNAGFNNDIIIIIIIDCNWFITLQQWLFYTYTNMEKK